MNIELSGAARNAYDHSGPLLAIGGPGSGKTTLALLKAKHFAPALKPGQCVLFLSFSRSAVQQVLASCSKQLTAAERKPVVVQTYHAFCLDLLRAHGRLLTGFPPQVLYPGDEHLRRAEFTGDWSVETARLGEVEGVFAFDRFAEAATRLILGSDTIGRLIADKYPFVILDEFQDTSDDQWELVQQLARRSELIFLADPEQRIFDYDPQVDPLRLEQLEQRLKPTVFDLGGQNHRSPNAGILAYANAVLHCTPAPQTPDVVLVKYPPRVRGSAERTTHLEVIRMFNALRKQGVQRPSIAVLARSNSMVATASSWLSSDAHRFNGRTLPPIAHDVAWDADLAASAAIVVGTILEWPGLERADAVARTIDAVADFCRMKNAVEPKGNKSALDLARRLSDSAVAVRGGTTPRINTAKHLLAAWSGHPPQLGDPVRDWLAARAVLQGPADLAGVFTHARFTRLFGATDEIGGQLAQQWDATSSYLRASAIVKRAIDAGRIAGDARQPNGCIVMSLHKSKGKEFDGVLIVEGAFAGVFFNPDREQPPFESTRRLLRVGITRARYRVAIVRPAHSDEVPLTR